jgi:hypothetical protein
MGDYNHVISQANFDFLPTASNEIKMDGKMAAGLELLYGVSY